MGLLGIGSIVLGTSVAATDPSHRKISPIGGGTMRGRGDG